MGDQRQHDIKTNKQFNLKFPKRDVYIGDVTMLQVNNKIIILHVRRSEKITEHKLDLT